MVMKNIHVLPTDKPSRLHFTEFGEELVFTPKYEKLEGVNIYITSDEEIREGDYYLYGNEILKADRFGIFDPTLVSICKKIILTTDQDLIKDGVWGIEDGFLEWFVKNPTCEYVELKGYAIVLPGESCDCDKMCSECEAKQETLEELTSEYHTIAYGKLIKEITNEETLEYGLLQHIKTCLECNNESQAIRLLEKYGFEKQEERYSEEDMKQFALKCVITYTFNKNFISDNFRIPIERNNNNQFEQFKKK